jgi:hypothetical protein
MSRTRKYKDNAERQAAYRARKSNSPQPHHCLICHAITTHNSKYCSPACRQKAYRIRKNQNNVTDNVTDNVTNLFHIIRCYRRGQLISFSDLRRESNLSHDEFDQVILQMANTEKIWLHKHVDAFNASQEYRNECVSDGESIYVGCVLRDVQ